MSAMTLTPLKLHPPLWLTAAAIGGIGWNLFGLVQFAGSVTATDADLIAAGLSAEQAAVITTYPVWMTAAFGLGVLGGIIGSVLLLMRHARASTVLLASLIAYVALWIGDAVHGVFAALGTQQVAIISTVVIIAAALFAASRHRAAKTPSQPSKS